METHQTQHEITSTPALAPKKMGKLRASYLLTIEGLELLKKDKQVLLFPIFSALASIAILAIFCFLYWIFSSETGSIMHEDSSRELGAYGYVILLIMYLLLAFTATFFQAGLTVVVDARINGKSMTFREGVKTVSAESDKIFLWAFLSATVGVILGFISDRAKWLGKLAASLLGAAWEIVTFFIIPALILEKGKMSDAIKSSAGTFRKTWGETIIINFSTGLFLSLVAFLAIILAGLGVWGVLFLPPLLALPLVFILVVSLVLFLIGICVLSSALNSIFRVVLYEYAKSDRIADTFAPELILGALKRKE